MTPKQFERRIRRDLAKLKKDATAALQKTAEKAVKPIQEHAPVAFGHLRESTHAETMKTVVSAPHASAVEEGSRPHYVPLEDLIDWVKLRGMQGLSPTGKVRRADWVGTGSSTGAHARSVARELRGMENEGALDVNAPEVIAKRIQAAIAKNGTKPHRFVHESLGDIERILHKELGKVFK